MLRIAQIGVGYWGPNLLRNLIANGNCEVPIVAELSTERQEYVKGLYPAVQVTKDPFDIIENKDIDAVVIATPVASHYELAMRSLAAGKHILVEKPLARSVQEVEDIERVAAQKSLVAMVGHTFLFNSAVNYVKKLIDSGQLGSIRYIYSQRLNLGRCRCSMEFRAP